MGQARCSSVPLSVEAPQCTTNAYLFELWFLLTLLPLLAVRHPGGCNVIMDNASIHRPAALRLLAASFGVNVRVIFLPAYSPELNPVRAAALWAQQRCRRPAAHALASGCQIELLFGWMKCTVRRGNVTAANLVASVLACAHFRRAA